MSPGSHCYFDHYQGKGSDEPLAIGGYTPLEKVYQFEPIPEALSPQEQHYILGAQANVWTEYIPSFSQVEYMVYPRALALSQVLWTIDKPSYDAFFADFLRFQVPFLNRLNVTYSRTFAKPTLIQSKSERGIRLMLERSQFGLQNNVTWTKDGAAYKPNQLFGEKDSMFIERTSDEKIIRNEFSISNAQLTSPTKTTIIQHPSLGIDVTYMTKPAEQYNAAKELALVDGVVGSLPWKGNEWVGFREKQITFKVDLGQKKIISAIELGFLEDHGSWIHYPDSIEVLVSKKGKKWKSVKVVNWKDGELVKGSYLTKKISLSSKARYVKIDIIPKKIIEIGLPGEGNLPWTFLDELIIF
jgi:hexosaminidase